MHNEKLNDIFRCITLILMFATRHGEEIINIILAKFMDVYKWYWPLSSVHSHILSTNCRCCALNTLANVAYRNHVTINIPKTKRVRIGINYLRGISILVSDKTRLIKVAKNGHVRKQK